MDHLDDLTPSLRDFEEMLKRLEGTFSIQKPEDKLKARKKMEELLRKLDN